MFAIDGLGLDPVLATCITSVVMAFFVGCVFGWANETGALVEGIVFAGIAIGIWMILYGALFLFLLLT
jgi:hypothetical protein